jgi:hypothetical protein
MMRTVETFAVAVMSVTVTLPVMAQKTVVKSGDTAKATAIIQQIDPARRFVRLRRDDGSEIGVFAPPELARFNELMIGDTVTISYYESIVYRLRRPGTPRPSVSDEVGGKESAGPLPGATFSHQVTERVTVRAVNQDIPSVTVVSRDGRIVTRHVDDPSDLVGVQKGDLIDITYTEALLATVARAK